MHRLLSIALCFCLAQTAFSQAPFKDTYWKLGRHAGLDFSSGTPNVVLSDGCQSTLNNTSTQICDRNNHVLFYSIGLYMMNRQDNLVPNWTNINNGTISSTYVSQDFYPPWKAAVIIPFPNDSNKFYMFYENLEWSIDGDYQPEKLYYLVVDKTLDGGLGDVTLKDQIVIQHDTLTKGEVLAVKHGNGKDWWIVCRKFKSNRYYKILVDANGVHPPISQDIGLPYTELGAAVGVCNQTIDGEKMVFGYFSYQFNPQHPTQIDVFDFDRCSGVLNNNKQLYFPNIVDSVFWGSFCFSPRGRFLYCTEGFKMWQLDLSATNILNSKIQVGTGTNFFSMKIGSDNKIYISPYGSSQYIHVINNPDSLGIACGVQLNAIDFGGNGHWADGGMPNVPNFALGPKAPCGIGIEEIKNEVEVELFPNPADNELLVNSKELISSIKVFNITGEQISQTYSPLIKQITLQTNNLLNGIYIVETKTQSGKLLYTKLVVQH
jgi:Secretion system C-terminal sorting domain